ncbi:dihydrolipoamide acetyltransferase family protein [Tengunoibacter tsumagoiensis]|uniref:Dihydrolipoamide acetyltransferase component of pyruvate dehydrogenase complex n=1 Tax=Tengunoibacter tsumagoiensis TaxID=2014871 RepID=A0A402A2I1_9CHLR|nr:dihydrolipoamide acetyltransferase family protein [Tengunoibacter tsumagoiensis]GCE13334.1 lipoamide acyltransferase component of branched-chain alpha-keto acid dehydrogenase complex [Tengunoibacter tsumagoiensis]
MPTSVTMPRLGESVAEGTIGAWLKNEGDYVERDEALAEVITDKINAELPSPVAGRLAKILVNVDETVSVGAAIALIEESAEEAQSHSGPDASPVDSLQEAATPLHESERISGGGLNGNLEAGATSAGRRTEEERQRISPLARRLAYEHGIDLNIIHGTGAGGRVRKEDILSYVEQRRTAPTIAPQVVATNSLHQNGQKATTEVPALKSETVAGVDEEILVPSRMRLAIAEHMVRSKRTSPHATTVVEVDMTNIAKWLAKNKEDFKQREGYGISFVPFVMKAVCEGLRKIPLMNSTWTEDNKIIIKKRINLGMAVATETGLVVPTIYDADQLTVAGLARQVNQLAQRARANKLTVQDLQNSTFVVNNPGVFGTIISMPIINQPHAGILSMDAVVKRPVVIEDDAIAVRSMMYISLSFDHRILDGAGAGGFLQAIRTKLQSYGREIDVY